jgi:8-oxo-dGTP diphosphatase
VEPVHVVAAVLFDPAGRVLLTRRHDHLHQGGLWEFPGGKLEPGETVAAALRREIREELGLELLHHRPLIAVRHRYPDCSVLLDVQLVTEYRGEPAGLEGQPLAWAAPEALADYPMPAADRPVVAALNLPDRCLITGPDPRRPAQFLQRLNHALARGIRLVQLRAPELAVAELRSLAFQARELCHTQGARLLLNGPPELALEVGADGVHLTRRRLLELSERPLAANRLVAASCHNAAELAQASRLGLDFAFLSPVLPTASHPEATPLGWDRFAELVAEAALPVYALGGMKEEHLAVAWEHGAQGIAAIGGFWFEP